jgi:aspartate-semialdehyde dehydrogenase
MLKVCEERSFPVTELIPVASEKSVGKEVFFQWKTWTVVSLNEAVSLVPDIALFSAGASVSREWAPKFCRRRNHSG